MNPLLAIALGAALCQIGLFVIVLGARLTYPMDLEWLEGSQLYMAFRIAHGLPVFGPPSTGFVPCPYPPLYHLVVAALGRGFGFDYWNGRLVSDASIAVIAAVQIRVVLCAAPSRRLGWVLSAFALGAVAASYRLLGASLDLARVDTFGVALVMVAALCAAPAPLSARRAAILGVLACAAVYAKQSNVFFVLWILGYLAWRDRRSAVVAGGVALALAVPPLVWLQRATDGWFWRWMMIMRLHPYVPAKVVGAVVGVVIVFAALHRLVAAMHARGWLREATRFWLGLFAASVPACLLPTLTISGWVNNLIGLVMTGIVLALLLACDVLRHAADRAAAERLCFAAFAALFVGALYDPTPYMPGEAREREAQALHATVQSLDGDVLLPMYPFVAARDGVSTPQLSLLTDWDTAVNARMPLDIGAAIRDVHARWIVLLGHDQDAKVVHWVGPAYRARALDVHVQALMQTTGRAAMLLERTDSGP